MSGIPAAKLLMVIPSIDGGELLARMLPTLRCPASWVVVLDQGSTDETDQVCAQNGVEVVQLGHAHTYTQACNIGFRLARERRASYLCVSNNDITFKTDVLRELLAEAERDPLLGIVAPSQVIIDETLSDQPLSYRVFWSLDRVDFFHDTSEPDPACRRLEADFCELTCALISMAAIEKIGFLDDEYGFYHEDADFGFRLHRAGYSCAYLPHSQIEHFSSSTFIREKNVRKATYIAKNKLHFADKNLGFRLRHIVHDETIIERENQLSQNIHPYLHRYGLLDAEAPELVIGYPGSIDAGFLYTPFEGDYLPENWVRYSDNYKAVFTTSEWSRQIFADAGFKQTFCVPMGIEPDIFNPWGHSRRMSGAKTYLMVTNRAQSKALRAALEAWHRFRTPGRKATLRLLGHGLTDCMGRAPDLTYRSGSFEIGHYLAEGIEIYEILFPIAASTLAALYRGVDFTIFCAAGGASSVPILESLACGTPCIFGDYGATAELAHAGALTFARVEMSEPTDMHAAPHRGFDPDIDDFVARLEESAALDACAYQRLVTDGLYHVLNHFTLRHTVMALYDALKRIQVRDPGPILNVVKRRQGSVAQAISWSVKPVSAIEGLKLELSRGTASRVATAGRMINQFGVAWQDNGFSAGCKAIFDEMRLFATHRSRQVARLAYRATALVRDKIDTQLKRYKSTPTPVGNSVLLVGYIDADLGLGESLRGLALAMETADLPFAIYPFVVGVEGRRSQPFMERRYDLVGRHTVTIVEVATNELPTVFANISKSHFEGSYTILRTYWELSNAPEQWRANLERIDEIWAPNEFVAGSFAKIFDGPITIVPPCVQVPAVVQQGRELFDLDANKFYFLFSFDYFSFPQRKNPLAVVRAFRKAFPDPSLPVGLIVKSTGAAGHFPDIKRYLRDAARQDGRIELVDTKLTRPDMLALISVSDCYVSLHRAEGFGLGMAEAMAFGKPVIGTAYSGNTDFLSERTGYPIPFKLQPVPADGYIFAEGQVWAEPSEAACAAAMVSVFEERDAMRAKAQEGQRFVKERYGPANVGAIAEARLTQIFGRAGR